MATTIGTPTWVQALTYAAADDRTVLRTLFAAGGVSPGTLAVAQNGTPNMSVNVTAGQAVIGRTSSTPADYWIAESPNASTNLVIATSDPTNPRIDIVCITINDAQYSGGTNSAVLQVVTGTPAGSPVQPSTPNNSILLATVAVAASAATIVNANITDKRIPWKRTSGIPANIVFTGSSTLTAAQAVGATALRFRVQAAGGGGGGCVLTGAGQCSAGGFGGGGGYAEAIVPVASLVFPLTVTVGAAGTAGGSGTAGGNGGTSLVQNASSGTTWASATGGQTNGVSGATAATGTQLTNAGNPGVGTVGDILVSGGAAAPIYTTVAGSFAPPVSGSSFFSGGVAQIVGNAGLAGPGYGAGAAGATNAPSGGARVGALAGGGIVIVELIY